MLSCVPTLVQKFSQSCDLGGKYLVPGERPYCVGFVDNSDNNTVVRAGFGDTRDDYL